MRQHSCSNGCTTNPGAPNSATRTTPHGDFCRTPGVLGVSITISVSMVRDRRGETRVIDSVSGVKLNKHPKRHVKATLSDNRKGCQQNDAGRETFVDHRPTRGKLLPHLGRYAPSLLSCNHARFTHLRELAFRLWKASAGRPAIRGSSGWMTQPSPVILSDWPVPTTSTRASHEAQSRPASAPSRCATRRGRNGSMLIGF